MAIFYLIVAKYLQLPIFITIVLESRITVTSYHQSQVNIAAKLESTKQLPLCGLAAKHSG